MSQIYTAMDLGSSEVKVIVAEKYNNNFNVLATSCVDSSGIKNGEIVNMKEAITCVKRAIREIYDQLGIKISKTIVCIPPANSKMTLMQSTIDITDANPITGSDISNAINLAIKGNVPVDKEVVVACPIAFSVDNIENVKDPKGMSGNKLQVKAVVSLKDKEKVYKILEVLKLSGVDAVDICYSSTGDYFAFKNAYMDANVGAVINIGLKRTNISIFNHGIEIKNSQVDLGSKNVDDDIAYIFKINNTQAKKLKESFALAQVDMSDSSETVEVKNLYDEMVKINQEEISKIVEARLEEILSLCKKSILNLTNRKISYIIFTGGATNVAGFQNIVDKYFHGVGQTQKLNIIGIRDNKYSSSFGAIKYIDDKLLLRGKNITTITEEESKKMRNQEEVEQEVVQKKNKFSIFDI